MNTIISPQLSHIETYLYRDNRPSHPLDFFVQLELEGDFCPERFQAAIGRTLPFHPLLQARVSEAGRQLKWCLRDSAAEISFQEQADSGTVAAINIQQNAGLKCWFSRSQPGTVVTFQFHHAATDGLGAFGFIEDVLRCYSSDETCLEKWEPRSVSRLKERHWCGYEKDSILSMVRRQAKALYASREFSGREFVPVKQHQLATGDDAPADSYPHFLSHQFSQEETQAMDALARRLSVSRNTLLLRNAFVAVDQFRQNLDEYSANDWMRIAVPGNVRFGKTNDNIPAANLFSMTFPAFSGLQISDHTALLQQIQQNMTASRRDYYLPTFLLALKAMTKIPGAMERTVKANKCMATFLLTNVGCPLQDFSSATCRDSTQHLLVVANVQLIPPMRPFQTISLAVMEHNQRQNVTMSYDARVHSQDEVQQMMNNLVQQFLLATD
ncbi:MAG: hypothetical protein WBH50_13245 [Fuerstiella sp.]